MAYSFGSAVDPNAMARFGAGSVAGTGQFPTGQSIAPAAPQLSLAGQGNVSGGFGNAGSQPDLSNVASNISGSGGIFGQGGIWGQNSGSGLLGNKQDGVNWGGIGTAIGGLKTLAGIWGAYQNTKLAKKSLAAQTHFAQKNLEGTVKAFNNANKDQGRSRAAAEGQTHEQRDDFIKSRSLTA